MNNDLISREALKKAIDEVHQKDLKANPLWGSIGLNTLNRLIDNAPAVDERPQGDWIIHNNFDGWVECPFCHVGHTVFGKLPKFCENCGADLREEARNE